MEKYLGRKRYAGWDRLIENIRNSDTKIINLCNSTSQYIYKWLNKTKEQVITIYPCINSKVLDSKQRTYNKENYVVFISRLVKHKRFNDVVYAVSKTNTKLKVISSVNAIRASDIVRRHKMKDRVEFHIKADDSVKFDIITNSSGVINGSIFEGFGMYAAEAIACGVPFIGYDYPTFREIKEYTKVDNFYLAESKNRRDLKNKLQMALKHKRFNSPSKLFHFEEMIKKLKNIEKC
jgi:glycosyltransferase involved in cell wall biosynthesis